MPGRLVSQLLLEPVALRGRLATLQLFGLKLALELIHATPQMGSSLSALPQLAGPGGKRLVLGVEGGRTQVVVVPDRRLHRHHLAPRLQEGGAVGGKLVQDVLHREVQDGNAGS